LDGRGSPLRRSFKGSVTVNSSEKTNSSTRFVLFISCAAALGGFLFGFDTSVINGAILALQNFFFPDASAATAIKAQWLIGLAVSLSLLSAAIGAFFAGQMADRYGRIRCMVVSSIIFLISAIGSGLPTGIYSFIVWRVLGGFGVGAASVIVPAYIAETSPAHIRGRMGSIQQLAIVVGIFAALVSNFLIVKASGSAGNKFWFNFESWRWMFWLEGIPAVIYGVCALFLPESPRYLVEKDRNEEASKVLARLLPAAEIRKKIAEIKQTVVNDTAPKLSDLWDHGKLKKIVWIGLGLAALQQLVGINVIFYYGNVLWQSVGFRETDSLMLNVLSSVINIATTIIAILLIDKIGRKKLLLIGSGGMSVTLILLTIMFAISKVDAAGNPMLSYSHGLVAVIAANVYIVFFGMSWGPVMWVLLGEMFPNRIRGAALALSGLVQWLANFAVSTTFLPLKANVGLGGAYGCYSLFSVLSIFFVIFVVRETKGKELEDM
jgi:sugar porter (SP) family MFS transporter